MAWVGDYITLYMTVVQKSCIHLLVLGYHMVSQLDTFYIILHCAGIACSTFAGATEYLFSKTHLCGQVKTRSRISLRHRITSQRRFSKTLFPQPNFSPPPNYLAKTLFEDTFPAAEFLPATELPTEDAFRRHFSRSQIYARHRIFHSEVKKNNTARATDQGISKYMNRRTGDDFVDKLLERPVVRFCEAHGGFWQPIENNDVPF